MEAFQMMVEACARVDEAHAMAILDDSAVGNPASTRTYPAFKIFGGFLESQVEYQLASCGQRLCKREPLSDLQVCVPVGPSVTLEAAIKKTQEWEKLPDSPCGVCRKSLRRKRVVVTHWPACLMVHVKRWEMTPAQGWVKNNRGISFEEQMLIGGTQYSLRAVVCHIGGVENGHYICYARQAGSWHRCNDEVVTECELADVLRDQAYILVYGQ